jgi:hypothetical protein
MHSAPFPVRQQIDHWSKALQLLFVGLYAFVLPFICWGAQATPGHSHASPHFVFVEPSTPRPGGHPTLAGQSSVEQMKTAIAATICGAHALPFDLPVSNATQQPAGQSTPSQLVISTLFLVGAVAALQLRRVDGPGSVVWLVAACAAPFCFRIPTPPPR